MTMRTLTIAALSLLIASTAFAGPVVKLQAGRLEGVSDAGVERYLGIPYAEAPVGGLRWRAPQPVKSWQGVRKANAFGPDCVQQDMENPPGPGFVNPTSEDCLYLNVWRPQHVGKKPLPVMVWIYGGAFIMGAASYPSYDGTAFARNDVIMVSLNYRVGRFGFFAHPSLATTDEAVGNYGLMDQIKALEWVKANIKTFGGDPGNVTIFGESAGASSVNFLMASPAAKGLFQKAISQSGGTNASVKPLAKAEADGLAWALKKGATDAETLRALPTATVLDAPVLLPESVIADGRIVLKSTPDAYRAGEVAPIPYLVGSNGYEESLIRWLPGADKAMLDKFGPEAQAVIDLYMRDGTPRDVAVKRMWGDLAMTLPARWRASEMAKKQTKVWLYRYSYVPETLRATLPGAGHEAEIEMVFDIRQSRTTRHDWTPGDLTMAKTMNLYWINFAKTGNPNRAGLNIWPSFTSEHGSLMHFSDKGIAPVADFAKAQLDALEAASNK